MKDFRLSIVFGFLLLSLQISSSSFSQETVVLDRAKIRISGSYIGEHRIRLKDRNRIDWSVYCGLTHSSSIPGNLSLTLTIGDFEDKRSPGLTGDSWKSINRANSSVGIKASFELKGIFKDFLSEPALSSVDLTQGPFNTIFNLRDRLSAKRLPLKAPNEFVLYQLPQYGAGFFDVEFWILFKNDNPFDPVSVTIHNVEADMKTGERIKISTANNFVSFGCDTTRIDFCIDGGARVLLSKGEEYELDSQFDGFGVEQIIDWRPEYDGLLSKAYKLLGWTGMLPKPSLYSNYTDTVNVHPDPEEKQKHFSYTYVVLRDLNDN